MKKSLMIAAAAALMVSGLAATEAVAGPEAKCKACHSFEQGGPNKTGPNLFGIVGKKAGTTEGFSYGDYLSGQPVTWDEENLKAWLENSVEVAKAAGSSTKMPKQNMTGDKAEKVIEFLKTLQ